MSTSKRDKVTRVPVESSRRVRVSRYPCRRPLWAAAGGGAHLTCSDDPPAPPLHSTPTGGAEGTVGGNRLSHRLCSCDYSLEYPRNKKSFRAAAERRSAGVTLTVLERPDDDGRRDGAGAVGVVRPHYHRVLHPWPERRHHLAPTSARAHAHHTKVVGAVVAQTRT